MAESQKIVTLNRKHKVLQPVLFLAGGILLRWRGRPEEAVRGRQITPKHAEGKIKALKKIRGSYSNRFVGL